MITLMATTVTRTLSYKEILKIKYPDKKPQRFTGPNYNDIVWSALDNTPNPTKQELDTAIDELSSVPLLVDSDEATLSNYFTALYGNDWSTIRNKPTTFAGYGLTQYGYDVFKVNALSSTSQIPQDTSTPLISEGTEILKFSKVPTERNTKANIFGSLQVMVTSANRNFILALFRDMQCIAVAVSNPVGASKIETFSFNFLDEEFSNTLVAKQYSLRLGINSTGTWYLNKTNTANLFSNLLVNNCVTFKEF